MQIYYVHGNFKEMMKLSQVLYEQLMCFDQIQEDKNELLKLIKYFISILSQTNQMDYLIKILQNIDLQIDQIEESLDNAETLQYIYLHLCLYHYENKDYEKCIKYINKCSSQYNLINYEASLICLEYICLKNEKRFDECNYLKQNCDDIFKKNGLNFEQLVESQINCYLFSFITQNVFPNLQEIVMNTNEQNNSFEDNNKYLNQIKDLELNIFNINKLNEILPDINQIIQQILKIEEKFSNEYQNDMKQDQYIETLLFTHQKLIKLEQNNVINCQNILENMQNLQLQYLIKQDYNKSAEWAIKIHFLLCQKCMYSQISFISLDTQIPLTLKSLVQSEYKNETQNYFNFIFHLLEQSNQEDRILTYLNFLCSIEGKFRQNQLLRNYLFETEITMRSQFDQNKQNDDFNQQFKILISSIAYLSIGLKDQQLFVKYFKEFWSLKKDFHEFDLPASQEISLRQNYSLFLLVQKQFSQCEQFIKDYLNLNIINEHKDKFLSFIINIILFCSLNKQKEIDFYLTEFQSFINNNYNDQSKAHKKNEMMYVYKTLYHFSRKDYNQAIYFINFFLKYNNQNVEEIREFVLLISILYETCDSQEIKNKLDKITYINKNSI